MKTKATITDRDVEVTADAARASERLVRRILETVPPEWIVDAANFGCEIGIPGFKYDSEIREFWNECGEDIVESVCRYTAQADVDRNPVNWILEKVAQHRGGIDKMTAYELDELSETIEDVLFGRTDSKRAKWDSEVSTFLVFWTVENVCWNLLLSR